MKTLIAVFLSIGLVLAIQGRGAAQPPDAPAGGFGPPRGGFGLPGGPGGPGISKMMLLMQDSVRQELDLTEKQLKQVQLRGEKQRESLDELREEGLEPEEAMTRVAKIIRQTDTAVGKLLTAKQRERLDQIALQQRGPRALGEPEIAKKLALTNAQKKKIASIEDEAAEELRSTFGQFGGGFGPRPPRGPGGPGGFGPPGGGGPNSPPAAGAPPGSPDGAGGAPPGGGDNDAHRKAREEAFSKMRELRSKTEERLRSVLTEDQQSQWDEMLGPKFEGEIRFGFGPPGPPPEPPDAGGDAPRRRGRGRARDNPDEPSDF